MCSNHFGKWLFIWTNLNRLYSNMNFAKLAEFSQVRYKCDRLQTNWLTPFGKHLLHSDKINLHLYELSSALTLWSGRTSWYNHVLYFRGLWGLPGHGQWDVLQPLLPWHVPALQDLHLADKGPGAVQDLTQLHPFRYRGHKCKNYSSKKTSFSYEAFQKFFIMKSMPVDKTGFFPYEMRNDNGRLCLIKNYGR